MIGLLVMWGLRLFVVYAAFTLTRKTVASGETPLWRVGGVTIAACLFLGFLGSGPPGQDGDEDPLFGGTAQGATEDVFSDYPFKTVTALLIASALGFGAGMYGRRRLATKDG